MYNIVWRDVPANKGRKSGSGADVTIGVHKAGKHSKKRVKMSFRGKAKGAIGDNKYAMVSDVMSGQNRIYFLFDKTRNAYMRKIIDYGTNNKQIGFTPKNEVELDIYLSKWVGDYELKFDANHGLNYIEVQNEQR